MTPPGAGDSAVAGFLTAVLHGCDLATAADYACAAGAQNLRALDATSGIGSWEQLTAELYPPRAEPAIKLS